MMTYTLITGASQGFGKAMAIECASRNMNLILVSLPNSGLMELSQFLEKTFLIRACFFETDLSSADNCLSLYHEIQEKSIKVKYLINNAGILSKGYFEDLEISYIMKQIQVNINAPALLIKLFSKHLQETAPSGVLNVGSLASFFYLPKKQIYGGTKAFLLSFSQSLRREFLPYNISVSTICPGGMNTNTALSYQNRTGSWLSRLSIMDPEEAAKIAIDGLITGKEIIIPGKLNKFFMFLNKILPKRIKEYITRKELNKFEPSVTKTNEFYIPSHLNKISLSKSTN